MSTMAFIRYHLDLGHKRTTYLLMKRLAPRLRSHDVARQTARVPMRRVREWLQPQSMGSGSMAMDEAVH